MSPRWSLRASSPQLPKLGMELKINTMDGELIEVGSSEAARKVILLHGLTGTGSVIKPVAEYLRRSLGNDYSFLLPTASVIRVKQFNGEPVHAWFDVKNCDFRKEVDVDGIFESSQRIGSMIRREMARGISPDDIFLGGFSQGGVIALTAALLEPFPIGGVFALSSYLPLDEPLVSRLTDASKTIPIFLGVSLKDEFISQEASERASSFLANRGNPIQTNTYDMKHEISNRELDDVAAWMKSLD
ncbi:alpha/beta hydrolase [Parasutterella excrementihominis]|uniref:alpha/beta hydrolase n=1 Tax=Parasutterella excrementihominis TaxID=487175 RepID=UPI002667002D|nr:carboxylesterase [Parasutterella excrementihominis]